MFIPRPHLYDTHPGPPLQALRSKLRKTGPHLHKKGLPRRLAAAEQMCYHEEQIKLLATDGMLVKRPLIVADDFILTGFRENEWKEKME